MTQIFDEKGNNIPVTVLEAGPCVVTGIRRKEKEGYNAVQLAYGDKKERTATKPELGFFKKLGMPLKDFIREMRTEAVSEFKIGDELRVDNFEVGDYVDVEGRSIGKGFQGVVKRHRFRGGPKSHGSMFGRAPGSIGASSFPSRVVKGMRAAGHMGAERSTTQNLKVVKIDSANHLMAVRGAVPGVEDGYVIIYEAVKRNKGKAWKITSKKVESVAAAEPAASPTGESSEEKKS
jgi:large subunit ribosomal protein L3